MRNIATLIMILSVVGIMAQNRTKNCVTPISNYVFSQKFALVNSRQGDAQKLDISKSIIKTACLSTEQVKQIAELFDDDLIRLTFVQDAYAVTTDKDNFYDVYNSFRYFSTVFRLHDYISGLKGNNNNNNTTVVVEEPESNEMAFPNIQYPDYRRYFGRIGCKNIMPDDQFMQLAQKVFEEKFEPRKLLIANNYLYNKCLLTEQTMKLASLLRNESDQMDFFKKAYTKVYDPDNYRYVTQLLTEEKNKQEIQNLLSPNVEVINDNPPCETSDSDFQGIVNQINKESFNNTKINLAKQIIKSKGCFKTNQIIELLKLFSYSDSKMIIAKYAYDFTTDKDNYYKVADSFSFSRDKDEILKFIKSK